MIHISQEQIQQFDELGFLVLRQWIPANLVKRLRSAVESAIEGALADAQPDTSPNEFCLTWIEEVPFVVYIDHLHRHASPASLELAGSEQMRSIGQAFCGDDYLVSYEYAVVKTRGDGERIPWHQDMIHDRTSRILNFGLYLSDATTSEGAVRVVPRTQSSAQDICALASDVKLETIDIEMAAGDVLLHDVMLAHSSEGLVTRNQRQVLYFELRSLKQLQTNPRVSPEWIFARQKLRRMAEAVYQQRKTGQVFPQQQELATAATAFQLLENVYSLPLSREGARYCIPQSNLITDAP